MQLPQLTSDQIQERCTEQSFMRGTEYFHAGAIGNPTLHEYTLSAICEGTDIEPYRVTVELTPTGIAAAYCSCPYDWEGDCKHIVALLLTYVHEPDTIPSLEPLLAILAAQPSASLLRIISGLLKRAPELVPIAQAYADILGPPPHPGPLPYVTVYRERIDPLFRDDVLELDQLHHLLIQLEDLRQQAEFFAQVGEMECALSILHALIHQSIVRSSDDTLWESGLLQFIDECTATFTEIVVNTQEPVAILEHCRMLLRLSFDTEPDFTPLLTDFLEEICLKEEISGEEGTSDLDTEIEQNLDKSPDREAHVQLLLALYLQSGRTDDYLRLAQSENER